MKRIQNFDGTLVINIGQKSGENVTYMKYTVENVNRLTLNQLAGTITKAVFGLYDRSKKTGVKLFKANKPVYLHITDNSNHVIADSAYIQQEFFSKMTFLSKDRFGRTLHDALTHMREVPQLATLNEVLSDKAQLFIGADSVLFEAEVAENEAAS